MRRDERRASLWSEVYCENNDGEFRGHDLRSLEGLKHKETFHLVSQFIFGLFNVKTAFQKHTQLHIYGTAPLSL